MITQDKRLLGGVAGAVLLAAVGGFSVARCTADRATEAQTDGNTEAEAQAHTDGLPMTADAIRSADIALEAVRAGGLGSEILAQATVTASPTGEAIVTARAGGVVIRVSKRLGDPVKAGEALAVVQSRDAAQIAADRTAAEARAELAQRNLARERQLYEQKVSARVDYEQAQAEAAAAAAEARRAQVATTVANVTRDGSGAIVSSPISGRVTAQNVRLGAFVQPETELFRVADPSKVQIEASVGPVDAQRLAAGDQAVVDLSDGRTIDARVRSITPGLGGETRLATVVLDVSGSLPPGLPVSVRLLPGRAALSSAIVIPEDALQSLEGHDVVFVRTKQGFIARNVTVGQRSAGRVEVTAGLKPGEMIATRNAFLLKAELGKGAGEEE